jgi:excinuclease ABC subunit C
MLYQVNLCCAPCVAKISIDEYREFISYARDFLSGNYGDLIGKLSYQMYLHAENMEFEQAGALRDKIGLVKQMQSKQIISDSQTPLDCDIVLFHEVNAVLYIYVIIVRNGLYVGDKHFSHRIHDDLKLLEEAFLERYYSDSLPPRFLYLNRLPEAEFCVQFQQIYKTRLLALRGGRIYELAAMGKKNLDKIIENSQLDNIYQSACLKLSTLLQLGKINRVECYDTSHHQGSNAIASMVVYGNGKIDHSLYRKFNLPDDINGNDLLALEHVLRRRLLNQELALPEVILVDGGSLQLNCAKNLIAELGLCDKIKVIAIFKGEHRNPLLDRIIITSALELGFREEPTIFKFLQALRDEAHRFAITGHRKKQAERMRHSRLEDIPRVGAVKRKSLIAFFGSAAAVAEASIAELQQIDGIGSELASVIYGFFHP